MKLMERVPETDEEVYGILEPAGRKQDDPACMLYHIKRQQGMSVIGALTYVLEVMCKVPHCA